MIIADKIIENRKKNGWSQEELADKLGVSRQSVSKWEGAQAVPDMKKIVQMSELFGVSTDYLLRDDIETLSTVDTKQIDSGAPESVRMVSMEEASEFLEHNERAATTVSTGVMLCILSPIASMLLGGLSEAGMIGIGDSTAGIMGAIIILIMVCIAVAMFLITMMRGNRFEYLEHADIDTAYGVSGMAKDRRGSYMDMHSKLLIVGILLCVASAIPLLLLILMADVDTRLIYASILGRNADMNVPIGVALLLVMVAVGVKMIVLTSIRKDGYDKLLEEGDYTRINKRAGKWDGVYWAVATAVYLAWSFISGQWWQTWIVFPIAGVVFAAYKEIMRAIVRAKV